MSKEQNDSATEKATGLILERIECEWPTLHFDEAFRHRLVTIVNRTVEEATKPLVEALRAVVRNKQDQGNPDPQQRWRAIRNERAVHADAAAALVAFEEGDSAVATVGPSLRRSAVEVAAPSAEELRRIGANTLAKFGERDKE